MMKTYFSIALLICISAITNAQCTFNPIITPSSLSLCPNQTDTLWTQQADSYQWFKSGTPIANSNQRFLLVNQVQDAGSSFIVSSTINGCSEASPSVLVSAYSIPALSISIANGLSNSGCEGDIRQLVLNDPFNLDIRWFKNGVQQINETNDTLNVNQSGLYSAVAFTDQCPLYSQTSALTSITFIPATTPTISFNSSNLELSTITNASSYQWYLNGIAIANSNSANFLPQANGAYQVEAIFSTTCSRISAEYSYTSFIQTCPHDPTISPDNLVLCPNSSDTLFTQIGDAYQWYKDGNLIPGASNRFLVVNSFMDSGSSFSVSTTLNSCTELSPSVLVDGWLFLPMTVITYGLDNPPLCEGDTLILQVNQPYTENITWFLNGNAIAGQTNDSLLVMQSGTYSVTGFTSLCPNYSDVSLPLEYNFGAAPTPELTYYPVSNTLGTTLNAVQYFWNFNGVSIPNATTQLINLGEAGTYSLNCLYSNGCSANSLPYQYVPTGFDVVSNFELNIQPNPAKDIVNIRIPEFGKLTLMNLSGQQVAKSEYPKGLHVINTADWKPGVYLFQFQSAQGIHSAKVLITD
jgi:hypothetical protein